MHDPCNVYRGRYKEFIDSILSGIVNNEIEGNGKENHHIIPRCTFKGVDQEHPYKDSQENQCLLSYRNHFIAHLILAEENPNNRDLCVSIHKMINDGKHPINTPEDYEKVKILFGKCQSDYMKEHSPWKFGKTDKQLEVSKRPKSDDTRAKISISVSESFKNPTEKMLNSYSKRGFASSKGKEILANLKFYPRKCLVCDSEFIPRSSTHKYCSNHCKEVASYLLSYIEPIECSSNSGVC